MVRESANYILNQKMCENASKLHELITVTITMQIQININVIWLIMQGFQRA